MNELTVNELKSWISEEKDFQLIDVREANEYEEFNIGGQLMPMSEFSQHIENIEQDKPVVVHCRSGVRSAQAIQYLSSELGYDNLLNLKGGILDWV